MCKRGANHRPSAYKLVALTGRVNRTVERFGKFNVEIFITQRSEEIHNFGVNGDQTTDHPLMSSIKIVADSKTEITDH